MGNGISCPTPSRGTRVVDTITRDTRIPLGAVVACLLGLIGGVLWLSAMKSDIAVLQTRMGTMEAQGARMETKLDRVLEKRP